MISMPPRHGKSYLCSQYLPAWFVGTYPDKRVMFASYEASFARKWGKRARGLIETYGPECFGVSVDKSSSAADSWDIAGRDGGMETAGVGGPFTGKGADLLIIDDPIKNSKEAHSEVIRESLRDWWESTAYTRLEPNGSVLIIQTRWHEDDLVGQLLSDMEQGGEPWEVLNLPAINANNEALWPERWPLVELEKKRRGMHNYYWSAMYQGNPTPDSGDFFKRENLELVESVPMGIRKVVRFWDKAGSATDGDFSSGALMGEVGGVYYLIDLVRGRWNPFQRNEIMRQTAELDALKWGRNCHVWIEQEPGNGGKESAMVSARELVAFGPQFDRPQEDKVTRARPLAAQVEAKNFRVVKGKFTKDFIDEAVVFPHGKHDDQVDACSGAFNKLVLAPKPVIVRGASGNTARIA